MARPDITPIAIGEDNSPVPVVEAFEYLLGTGNESEVQIGKPLAMESQVETIASGAITAESGTVLLRGQGDSDDTLNTINVPTGGFDSETEITLRGGSAISGGLLAEDITITNSGNINLAARRDFLIDRPEHSITLRWSNSAWYEVARSGFDGNSEKYLLPPSGTTAQRPLSPPDGADRFNTTTSLREYWDGSEWIPFSSPQVTEQAASGGSTVELDDDDVWRDLRSITVTPRLTQIAVIGIVEATEGGDGTDRLNFRLRDGSTTFASIGGADAGDGIVIMEIGDTVHVAGVRDAIPGTAKTVVLQGRQRIAAAFGRGVRGGFTVMH